MFARHDLLWLTERGWLRARASAAPECHVAIDAWRRAGWPAVARRSDAGLAPGEVAIIDLLLHPLTRAALDRGLSLLSLHARCLPLDGEIVFPNAKSVAWKELSGALAGPDGGRVIVKEMHAVSLQTTSTLLSALRAEGQGKDEAPKTGRAVA